MKHRSPVFISLIIAMLMAVAIHNRAYCQTENPPDTLVASVNGTSITEADIQMETNRIQLQAKTMGQPIDDTMMDAMREKVIQSLINREILFQQSKAKGITIDAIEIDSQMDQIKQRVHSDQPFESQLAEMGISMEAFRYQVIQATAIQKLLEMDVYAQTTVSEKEARIFFENNPQFFKKPEEVKASHILIQIKTEDSIEQKLEARQKIEDIQKKLAAGADFAELAKEFSEGPSNVNGGDLGYFDRKRMVKPFSDAAFSLQPGQVSDIVETRFGFHLIRVTDKKPKSSYAFENIKHQLNEMLQRKKIQEETLQYLKKLRDNADVKQMTQ